MINILLGLFSGIIAFALLKALLGWSLAAIILPSLIIALLVTFLLSRRTFKRLEGIMNRAVKEVESGRYENAIRTLKEGFSLRKSGFFVEGQLNSQIGVIYYIKKDFEKAFEYLKGSFSRNWVGMGMLACLYFRKNDYQRMKEVLEKTARLNKKEPVVWALYAYLSNRTGKRDEAVQILNRGIKYLPKEPRLKGNLLALQNRRPMKMRGFGDQWYQFHLDKTPVRYVGPKRGIYR